MRHQLVIGFVVMAAFLVGCANDFSTYDSGINEMKRIQEKYGVDFQKTPLKEAIPSLVSELSAFDRKVVENEDTKALKLLLDYRMRVLESDILLLEGFKWGDASTTEKGFGCIKGSERILNSSALRIMAAAKGEEAIEPLRQFIEQYPQKAAALDLNQRAVLSLTTTYAVVLEQAQKDKGNVEGFCKNAIAIVQDPDGLYHTTPIGDSGENP